jgi:hypothetical protein
MLTSCLVWTRQYYVVLPIALILATAAETLGLCGDRMSPSDRFYHIAAGAVSLFFVAVFILLWGGFMPPAFSKPFRSHELQYNVSATALALVYLGVIVVIGKILGIIRLSLRSLTGGGFLGVILALSVKPTVDMALGQWGSIFWNLAPLVAVRGFNLLFGVLAGFSLAYAVNWLSTIRLQGPSFLECFYALMIVGIILLFSLQPYAWERYIDPMLGIALSLLVAAKAELGQGVVHIRQADDSRCGGAPGAEAQQTRNLLLR